MPSLRNLGEYFDYALSRICRTDAELLLSYAFSIERTEIYTRPNYEPNSDQGQYFCESLTQRIEGVPLAYITGEAYFWNQKLHVSPHVLVPRPETELLVEVALSVLHRGDKVLDLGTGSGAIALALRSEINVNVVASDVDANALSVCRANASRLNFPIRTVRSDWYSAIKGTFDVVVSNPPYVQSNDPRLLESDIKYEPLTALATGPTGTEALQNVIHGAADHLETDGWLIVEHGYDQRDDTVQEFRKAGFRNVQCRNDYSHIPRVVFGQYSE